MMLCICIVNILMVGIEKSNAYNNEILQLSALMADRISRSGIQTVAVADFTDLQGNVTELGRFLAEHISVALAGSGRSIMVVDRTHIRTLLKEHKLSSTGLIDPSTAKQLGKIAGVEALITGTITPFGDTVDMTIKVLHTESAKIIDASMVSLAKTNTFEELLNREVTSEQLGTSGGTPRPNSLIPPQQQLEVKGFTFSLETCRRTGQRVTCTFFVTSNEQYKKLRIYATSRSSYDRAFNIGISRIVDDLGHEYKATHVEFGESSSEDYADKKLPAEVAIKASLKFENVSTQANFLTMLEISTYYEEDFSVLFRNIPLSK